MRKDLNESDQKPHDGLVAAFKGLEELLLPEEPIDHVADNGEAYDGSLVINVRLTDGRMAHFVFEEGRPIKMKIYDR